MATSAKNATERVDATRRDCDRVGRPAIMEKEVEEEKEKVEEGANSDVDL